jgi:hypothetical protein
VQVIFERDDEGKEYCPAYLKSRIYIDLIDNEEYETNYEKLLRNIYNKPEHSKPALGKMPEWPNEESVDFSAIRNIIKQVKAYDGKNLAKIEFAVRKFNEEYATALNLFADVVKTDHVNNMIPQIEAMKPLRDLFLDYVEAMLSSGLNTADVLGDFFEQVYNAVFDCQGRGTYSGWDFDFAKFSIWELLIGTTAILIRCEYYAEIFNLLNRTYFLKRNAFDSALEPQAYTGFYYTAQLLENTIKPQTENSRLYTLAGEILVNREKHPLINKKSLANADIVLYQLSRIFEVCQTNSWHHWFPRLYVYSSNGFSVAQQEIWSKMVSKRYCSKIMPLFGITTIDRLIDAVKHNPAEQNMRYNSCVASAPAIANSIEVEKIGTMP